MQMYESRNTYDMYVCSYPIRDIVWNFDITLSQLINFFRNFAYEDSIKLGNSARSVL